MVAISVGTVSVDVVPSVARFTSDLRRSLLPDANRVGREVGRQIARGVNQEITRVRPVRVDVDISRARADIARLNAELARVAGRRVEVEIAIDRNGDIDRAGRSLGGLVDVAGTATRSLGGLGAAAGLVRFAPLAAGGAAAAGALVQVAAAAAPAAGLLAALPAVIGGGVAAMVSLKLATNGVGDAFSAALGDDPKKFAKSLEGLSPAARSVAVELRALKPAFEGVRLAAQQALFAPLRGQLTAVAKALAGPVREGTRAVAREFGLIGVEVAKFARSATGVTAVRSLFEGVQRAMAAFRPALQPLLKGFASLAIAGVPVLERMGAAAGRAATAFGDWMTRFAESGRVMGVIDAGVASLKLFTGLAVDLGGVLWSVARAANSAGGGVVAGLSVGLDRLNAFLSGEQAQSGLRGFFTTLNTVTSAVGRVVGALVAGLRPAVASLAPVLSAWAGAFGKVVGAVAPILPLLGQLIGSLVSGVTPVFRQLVATVSDVAVELAGKLVATVRESIPPLRQLVTTVAGFIPSFLPLLALLPRLGATLFPLIPAVLRLAAAMGSALAPAIKVAMNVAVFLVRMIFAAVIPAFKFLVSYIGFAAGLLTRYFGVIGTVIRAVGTAATWLWANAIRPAFGFIAAAAKVLYQVVAVVLVAPLLLAFKLIQIQVMFLWRNVFQPAFRGIAVLVRSVLAPVFRWLYATVIKPVMDRVGAAIRTVWQAVIRPVFNALKSGVSTVAGAFGTAVDAIRRVWDKLRDAARRPVAFVVNTVFNRGILRMWNAVAKLVPGVDPLKEITGFARGGVLPGYAPGRDRLIAAVSPGEAVMRPEWTRAVGPRMVDMWNRIARTQGPAGIRQWFTGGDAMGGEGIKFARGGIVPGFAGQFGLGGIVGGFLKSAKDFFAGGLVKTATRAFGPLVDLARRSVGGTGFGDLAVGVTRGLIGKILNFYKPLESKITGGPGVQRALNWARGQAGKPYLWGGVGPNGYDCSGFMSAIVNVIRGRSPYSRLFTTHSFGEAGGPGGFVRGLTSGFRVGVTNAGVGHMAGTLGRVNVESSGSAGVRVGGGARGFNNGLFTHQYGLKFDTGGFLPTGSSLVYNGTGRPEPVFTESQWRTVSDFAQGGSSVEYHAHFDGMTKAAYESQMRAGFQAMAIQTMAKMRVGRRQ